MKIFWQSTFNGPISTGSGITKLAQNVQVNYGQLLSRDVAAKFPFLGRYYRRNEQALLVKARVSKSNIMAVCLGRNEEEIITFNPKHISTSHLTDPDTFDPALCAAHGKAGAA